VALALRGSAGVAEAGRVTRLAPALLALAAAVPALALTATPAAAAAPAVTPATVHVEAEAVRSPAAVVVDAAASGRRARALAPGRSLTVRLSAPVAGSRLVLRLRTASGATGQPAQVSVDGGRPAALPLSVPTWRDQPVGAGLAAGTHTVTVTNPSGRRPALLVDRVSVVPAHARVVAAAPPVDDAYETRIVQLVNAARTSARLPRLAVSTCADRYAEDWSATMARTSVFAHRPSLGPVLTACRAKLVGENIAYGNVSAEKMMDMWMKSAGHRANVLDPRFTHIGVGTAVTAAGRTYGTQNFLRL
jgi:uncharacterized protein YkwD